MPRESEKKPVKKPVKKQSAKKQPVKKTLAPKRAAKPGPASTELKAPVLLTGGNPQIAKADGDEPVQAYIAAMPGWKREIGQRLDALIVRTVPGVRKAVRWNTPFYGIEGEGWFMSFGCVTKYVNVCFFRGESLHPVPPVSSKVKGVRYFHIFQGDQIDEAQVTSWIAQASALPGDQIF